MPRRARKRAGEGRATGDGDDDRGVCPNCRQSTHSIIEQCQGLWTDGQTLWTSARYMLWRFRNDAAAGAHDAERRRPQASCRARAASPAAIDIHDIAHGRRSTARARPDLRQHRCSTASRRSATRRASARSGGRPSSARWRRRIAAISTASPWTARAPAYVSAVSRSDVADGWRERRRDGGVVIDVAIGRDRRRGLVDAAFAAAL